MYLYETHLHTLRGSACGRSEGREYPALYKALGYDGVFITDHFFQGNCAVPRNLPWEERVRLYMLGYLDAKAEGDRIGFDVFFGIEQNYGCDEYLIYGIDRDFLLAHPDIEIWPRSRLADEVHAYGGCVVQAHPFRERDYVSVVRLSPYTVDAVEGVNLANKPCEDIAAWAYAKALDLPMTCGSDIHFSGNVVHEKAGGTLLSRKIRSSRDFADAVRNREIAGIYVPDNRFGGEVLRRPTLPVAVYGRNDEIIADSADEWLVR